VGFEQAAIGIVNVEQYEELAGAIRRIFAPGSVEKFLRKTAGKGVSIRNWDAVLEARLLELSDQQLATRGQGAKAMYHALAVSDQGQMRELYLTKIEEVDPKLRSRFSNIYRYY
jgi:hypothetical protein